MTGKTSRCSSATYPPWAKAQDHNQLQAHARTVKDWRLYPRGVEQLDVSDDLGVLVCRRQRGERRGEGVESDTGKGSLSRMVHAWRMYV